MKKTTFGLVALMTLFTTASAIAQTFTDVTAVPNPPGANLDATIRATFDKQASSDVIVSSKFLYCIGGGCNPTSGTELATTYTDNSDGTYTFASGTIPGQPATTVVRWIARAGITAAPNNRDSVVQEYTVGPPTTGVSLTNPVVSEGDSGGSNTATITATLSQVAPIGGTTIIYEIENVTTDNSDFTHMGSSLVIPEGQTTGNIVINLVGDDVIENNETFKVNARVDLFTDGTFSTGNASKFTVLPGTTNCSPGSTLAGTNYIFEIGNQGTYDGTSNSNKIIEVDCQSQGYQVLTTVAGASYNVSFDASRRTAGGSPASVDTKVAAIDGNLPSGTELASKTANRSNTVFAFTTETFTFTATSAETTIAFTSNNTEGVGMIFDNLSVQRTGSFDAVSTVTIVNDDSPTLSLSSPSIAEGNSGTTEVTVVATISVAAPLGGTTVNYSFLDGSTDAADFDHTEGTVVIPQGQTTADIKININGDTDVEPNETFTVRGTLDVFTDGTFSTGDVSKFTVLPGITACTQTELSGSAYAFEIGSQGVYDGTSNTNKIIEVDCQSQGYQVLNTVAGAMYTVSFDASRRTAGGSPATVDTKVAAIDGSSPSGTEIASANAIRSNTTFAFVNEAFTFTATSAQTTIAFTATNTLGTGMIFDNLSVVRIGSFDDTSTVTITNEDVVLGVKDFELNSVSIYPNPVNSTISIKGINSVDSISIFNILGSQILVTDQLNIDVSDLAPAIYLMKIESNGSEVVKRFVKK